MKWIFCCLASLCLHMAHTQTGNMSKPLTIGDTLPDLVLTNVINYPVSEIRLSDLKGKLVILDFWATWCSSCISHFPEIYNLSREFAGKVQFLLVPPGNSAADSIKIRRFFAARSAAYRLPALTKDSLLSGLFPHQSIPHYVWINNGAVTAITDASPISAQHISSVLDNVPITFHEKKDHSYDADSSLLYYTAASAGRPLKSAGILTGYLDGMLTTTGFSEKEGFLKRFAINSPLLSLYGLAFHELAYAPPNRIIWKVKNVEDFVPDHAAWDTWKRSHSYCIEFTAPASAAETMPAMIKSTLDSYFGLETRFEKRNIPCLVLSANSKFKHTPKATKALVNTLEEKGVTRQLHGNSQQLCDYLDWRLPVPVINGMENELLDISLPDEPLTLENIKKRLAPYGLELVSSTRNIRVFVVFATP